MLYHIGISIVLGLMVGFIFLVPSHPDVEHYHTPEEWIEVMNNGYIVAAGFVSLVVSALLSGWQQFRYYKRKKESKLQAS